MIELVVHAFLSQKFLMIPAFYDPSVFQNEDGIGVSHSTEAMGDDKDGTSFHEAVHAFFNQAFRSRINAAGCFIKNENWGICHGCPCNSKKLALSLGKALAVSGDPCVISVRHPADKGIGVGKNSGFRYFFVGGVQFSKTNIISNSSGKEVSILEYDSHGTAKRLLTDLRISIPS